ncbi:hypothetical protein M0R45_019384 [Rubus argutus]|uniref:Uncharacterized protein n=1 Tax=Rubus argutus TaxID=59490 RepID=A0AAW1X7B1_RUBAR
MLWLSHLRFGEDELGGMDEVRVSVEFGSELGINLNLFTKEFGIQLVYEQENSEGREKHNVIAGDVKSQENLSHLDSDGNKSPFPFLFKHDDVSQADPL